MPHVVALVGMDGAGKTTQARLLAGWLSDRAVPATYHRNAGGRRWFGLLAGRLGCGDADGLLGRQAMLVVEALLRWLAIAYALVRSGLGRRVAVMDRYSPCQYASIRARTGREERLARWLFGVFPAPVVTCYIAVPHDQAYARIEARGADHEDLSHLAAVHEAYRGLPEWSTFVVIDGTGPAAEVQERVRHAVTDRWALVEN
ncbi:MAG: thymidylate kinase [Dactylosporangium sp.]|nr:thymidylate kinase [Dactylosporangium sp.]NNJ63403.1 thymidylate kinase [Dactylosporangium sp.]